METVITLKSLLEIIAVAGSLFAGYKLIKEIVEVVNNKHDQIQKWEEYDKQIKDIKHEQCLITYCMMATLDGLHQLGANGQVTEAKGKLEKHINQQAHGDVI